jgi:[CysO sulfur-carrier protein]-S-L-cysteine hydrolase
MPPDPCLALASGVRDAMLDHARRALPVEAVGMLGGERGRASLVCELVNLGGSRHFLVDPRSQYEAERRISGAGLSVLAIYHSHPGGGAALSEVDVAFASRLPMLQIVIALARPHLPGCELRAYRVCRGAVDEVQIVG